VAGSSECALPTTACEAELLQAIGRVRPHWRTAGEPCDILMLNDVSLPVTIHHVSTWEKVRLGAWADMAKGSVLLTSPADVRSAYPELAPTRKVARDIADVPARASLALFVSSAVSGAFFIREKYNGERATHTEVVYKRSGSVLPARAIVLPSGACGCATASWRRWAYSRTIASTWPRTFS
jgi:hypothetical protein